MLPRIDPSRLGGHRHGSRLAPNCRSHPRDHAHQHRCRESPQQRRAALSRASSPIRLDSSDDHGTSFQIDLRTVQAVTHL
jgi:hypothetical protein